MPTIQLLYDDTCPYCRLVAAVVGWLDVAGLVDLVAIESDRGQELLTRWHGAPVHSPHLRVGSRLYYGLLHVAPRVIAGLPFLVLGGVLLRVWRAMTTALTRMA